MDFTAFPMSKNGHDYALVVVDRLSKRVGAVPCKCTIDARQTADLFLQSVYQYYGPSDSIVSDRGPQFVSSFWDEFCHTLFPSCPLVCGDHLSHALSPQITSEKALALLSETRAQLQRRQN